MSAILTKLLWPILNPTALLLGLLLLGGLGWVFGALLPLKVEQAARRLLGLALVALLLVLLVPWHWAIRPLEDYFPQPDLPAQVDGVLVLSGAERPLLTAARGQPQVNGSAERLFAFLALSRRYPEARLVFSGAGITSDTGGVAEADVAATILADAGLDMSRLEVEKLSRNTAENARLSYDLVKPQPGETWIMVTSAFHMPRAVACFQAVGWPVLPYPVDYVTMGATETWGWFDPLWSLQSLNLATREWLGLAVYRMLGHTRGLLPER